ncbi:Acetyltransferase (GNAT) family protein [Rickettsiales endosymbiont of Paramecium tredecaurelia]|uniref:GNAT family N-acetyltransferase n=1 Tax=Candidatus Sarmatiella mevalonica TaxID=2770581 RepID=UPI0019208161|nr:GNAT family protein [Candidatus Sarmatiella mevalonica]MBL3284531.1 Acetyltransferase (GNAT) family protein [Candidatus Sarmatiella mevalonica]
MKYSFEQFPVLENQDLVLRELEESDAPDYFAYLSKPAMYPFVVSTNIPHNMDKARDELMFWRGLFEQKYSIYWGITHRDDNKLVGTVGFNYIMQHSCKAELSYDLNESFWGRGIMTKALQAVIKFSDEVLKIVRLQATVLIYNKGSIKVLEKCGLQREGQLRQYEYMRGAHVDSFMYSRINYQNAREYSAANT